jgi:hypothetical protein
MLWLGLLVGCAAVWPQGTGAGGAWSATPAAATVGDTVWLERRFALPTGWRLRAGRLDGSDEVESLGDPTVVRHGADWVVRYPVAGWSPGPHRVVLPPLWRLGPDGQADSVPGSEATFELAHVIPASDTAPVPRPAVAPLRTNRRDPLPVLLAVVGAGATLAAAWWWRRRAARPAPTPTRVALAPGTNDERWLEAGEPRAVATRAAGRLRRTLARLVPEAHQGLSTTACLDVVRRQRPAMPVADLEAVLGALDRLAFAVEPDGDVMTLARRADGLVERLER